MVFTRPAVAAVIEPVMSEIMMSNANCAAFLGCGVQPVTLLLMGIARGMHMRVVVRDNCDCIGEPTNEPQRVNRVGVESVRALLGDDAIIFDHFAHPVYHKLVRLDEFADRRTLIITEFAADGFIAALKGIGVSVDAEDEAQLHAEMLTRPHQITDDQRWEMGVAIFDEFIAKHRL